jgi:hypothetical protein
MLVQNISQSSSNAEHADIVTVIGEEVDLELIS